MKTLPDLSALLGARFGGSSSNEPSTVPTVREEPLASIPDTTNVVSSGTAATTRPVEPLPSKRSAKKRPASDSSAATGQGGSSEAITGTHSAEPPKKKTMKKKKKTADGTVAEDQMLR